MKRDRVFLILAMMIIVGVLLVVFLSLSKAKTPEPRTVGTFNMEEYQWYQEHFSVDIHVGEVNDADTAIAKAQTLWSEDDGGDYPAEKIEVAFDAAEECWLVHYSNSPHSLGGGRGALIHKNGDVLAVWFED